MEVGLSQTLFWLISASWTQPRKEKKRKEKTTTTTKESSGFLAFGHSICQITKSLSLAFFGRV